MPLLCNSVLSKPTKVDFSFGPLHAGQYEALEKGRLDLVLDADHDTSTFQLSKEVIFEADFVCVVSRKSQFNRAITLKQYLTAEHVGVDIIGGVRPIQTSAWRQARSAGAYQESVRLANTRYDSGLANYFEVIDAKLDLYPVQQFEVQYDLERKVALINLYMVYGPGWRVETQRRRLDEERRERACDLE